VTERDETKVTNCLVGLQGWWC